MIGQKFGRLTVIEEAPKNKHNKKMWKCRCDCGNTTVVSQGGLRSGNSKSCGCYNREVVRERYTHSHNEMIGKTFGRLFVVAHKGSDKNGQSIFRCKCSCADDRVVEVLGNSLKSGNTQSCGCLNKENTSTHGLSNHPMYGIWKSIIQRCCNHNDNGYPNYGGRGITVCDAWRNDPQVFYDWSMSHGYRPGLSIDRIDNDRGYSPDNCRWATDHEQAQNKRNNKLTPDLVRAIREDPRLYSEIALRFGVSITTVSEVKLKKTWVNID
jgi:hypothetical protein